MLTNSYVILHIRPGPPYPDASKPQIALDARFELSPELWIERLETELAKNIQRACEPANHRIDNDVWDRHLYAFVRKIPENESSKYQGLQDLHTVIALSRLISPTSTGERYCARIFPQPENNPPIESIETRGVCPDVFSGDSAKDWLSPEDGIELRKLLPWVDSSKPMHRRVHHAFWNHEQAMRTYYLDLRWNLVVSGFEALINVEKFRVKQQFVRRVGALAKEFGIALSDRDLTNAYGVRSELAHAQNFLYGLHSTLPPHEHHPLYEKLERLLRNVIKKSLVDEIFGQSFASESAVSKRWP